MVKYTQGLGRRLSGFGAFPINCLEPFSPPLRPNETVGKVNFISGPGRKMSSSSKVSKRSKQQIKLSIRLLVNECGIFLDQNRNSIVGRLL